MSRRLLAALVLALSLAPAAGRAAGEPAADAASWRGRYCTPQGCHASPGAPAANAAGFAAAALGAGLLARRPRSR
jgi:MYXO-CTERM domain-containing protein